VEIEHVMLCVRFAYSYLLRQCFSNITDYFQIRFAGLVRHYISSSIAWNLLPMRATPLKRIQRIVVNLKTFIDAFKTSGSYISRFAFILISLTNLMTIISQRGSGTLF